MGGSFVFARNNDINHNIKQKPLRGRISKLAQHRAQPAGELPGSGHSRQIPWDSSSEPKPRMEEATSRLRTAVGLGLGNVSLNTQRLDVSWEFIQMALLLSHLPCR